MRETVTFHDAENSRLANLCGVLDENLRQIETALNVAIARRGEVFQVEGDKAADAARLLKDFYQRARKPWISTTSSWPWWKWHTSPCWRRPARPRTTTSPCS